MVLEKRKSFMQKSGTKRSLFRLRLRLLHAMIDIVLIVCLVVFAVAWLVSNDWDCLMRLRLLHAMLDIIVMRCFYYMEAFIWFSPWCFIWVDLAHAYNMFDSYKVAISLYDRLVFWLLMPSYASLNDVLSLCMIIAVIALLVGRSQSFASPHFVLSMSSTHASNSQKLSYSNVSTIHTY
jgi:hypothetical protein